MEHHGIALQVSHGLFSITAQVMGTPYSPDVFHDIATQAVRKLRELVSTMDAEEMELWQTGEQADEVFARLMDMTDESGD